MGILIKWNKSETNNIISNKTLTKRMSQWTKNNNRTTKKHYETSQMITTYPPSYELSTFKRQSLSSTYQPSFSSTIESTFENKTWINSNKRNNSITNTALSSLISDDHIYTTKDYLSSGSSELLWSSSPTTLTTTFSTSKLIPSLQSFTPRSNSSTSIHSRTSSLSTGRLSTLTASVRESKNIQSTITNNNTFQYSMKHNSDNRNDNIINLNTSNDKNNINDSIAIKNDDIAYNVELENKDFNDYNIKQKIKNPDYQIQANSDESDPLNKESFQHLSKNDNLNRNYATLKYQRYQQQQNQTFYYHHHHHNYLLQSNYQQQQHQTEEQHKYYHQLFTRSEENSFPLDNQTISNMTTTTANSSSTIIQNTDDNHLFLIMDDFNEYLVNYNTNGITTTNLASLNSTITDVDYPLNQFNLTNFDYRNECKDFYNVTNLTTTFNICETHNATTTVHEGKWGTSIKLKNLINF